MRVRVVLVWVALVAAGCAGVPKNVPAVAAAVPAAAAPQPSHDGVFACDRTVLRNMRPICVIPLSDEVRTRRETYLALVVEDGNPIRIERRRGAGAFSPFEDGTAVIQYDFQGGTVRRETDLRPDGRVIERTIFEEGGALRLYRDAAGNPHADEGSDATRSRVTFDARGFERERRYYDETGAAVRGKLGAHLLRYERDDAGVITETLAFDERGAPILTNAGWHRQRDSSGPNGCLVERALLGIRGQRVLDSDGTSGFRRTCDAAGLPLLTEHLGSDGKPAVDNHGHAAWAVKRDDHGNPVEISLLGLDGKPALGDRDYAIERRTFDATGRQVESAFFGANGLPVTLTIGHSAIRYRFDENDHVVEVRYFDESGHPVVPARVGFAAVRHEYDSRGRLVRTSYFDAKDRPVRDRTGAMTRKFVHDDADRIVVETLIEDGRLHDGRNGWAKATSDFGSDGKLVRRHFYRATGEEVELLGARWIMITFAGAKGTVRSIRSAAQARARAEEARARLVAGARWDDVARFYDEDRAPLEGVRAAKGVRFPQLDEALEKTPIDGITEVVETENGFFVMQRIP